VLLLSQFQRTHASLLALLRAANVASLLWSLMTRRCW
jgi:hypothetical protein